LTASRSIESPDVKKQRNESRDGASDTFRNPPRPPLILCFPVRSADQRVTPSPPQCCTAQAARAAPAPGPVCPQGLILIEIENSQTRLLKKDGGIAAPLSHAFDQVESWLHVVNDHKLAILDTLNVDRDMVSTCRGMVIAGRDRGQDAAHLKRLKGTDRGRVLFLTFDDLLFRVGALAHDIGNR
jgi:hypothetical protein